jgi:GGDEF domain-containing protein
VGTLGVSERILLKPGPLEPEERDVVELHPRIGFDVLTPMPALRDVATMVLHHHERYDGSGYPSGLSGDAIPLGARVLAVVDAFHAMTHDRPHRLAGSPAHAVEELVAGAGAQFDPELVQFFVEELRRREPRDAPDGDDEDRRSAVVVRAGRPLLGEDLASLTDALTLLPNHRAFHEAALAAAGRGGPFAVVLVEIESLADVNARDGYPAGDRVIQLAGRAAARVAHRHGATAYRDSGRRLGLLAPDGDQTVAAGLLADLQAEYASAPAVRLVAVTSEPGEDGESVIARARLRFGLDASLGRPEPR